MQKVHVDVLMGLPGSGKTHFANEYKNSPEGKYTNIVFMDELMAKYGWRNLNTREVLREGIASRRFVYSYMIDGLFLTNQALADAISVVGEYHLDAEVTIHRWKENREICELNDGGRRDKPSTQLIRTAVYEEVDVEWLLQRLKNYGVTKIDVVEHDVILKPDWVRFAKAVDITMNDGKLRSERWSCGGCHGNCYDSSMYYSDGEEPAVFTELYNFLDEKCPNLLYKDFRVIQQKCITTEEESEPEYYGGSTTYRRWVCDMEKLHSVLKELNYIKD